MIVSKPDTGERKEIDPSALRVFLAAGWVRGDTTQPEPTPEPAAEPEPEQPRRTRGTKHSHNNQE